MQTMVMIDGQLDADSVGASRALFHRLAQEPTDVVLDMRNVTSLDGSGLGALMYLFKRKSAMGGRLALANTAGQPRDLLSQLKVLALLELPAELLASAKDFDPAGLPRKYANLPAE